MAKKKNNPKERLGSTPMDFPAAPKTLEEVESRKRLAFAKAVCLLELLGKQGHFKN